MFDFVKKLLFSRQLKMEKGLIEALGQRMMLIPAYTFSYMLTSSKNPAKTGRFIYKICKHVNADPVGFTYRVSQKYKLKGGDLIRWMANVATMAGFGEIDVIKVDEKKEEALVHIKNSPMTKLIPKSKEPVDHPIRGYMAGAAEVIFNRYRNDGRWIKYDYLETQCQSSGDSVCEFILKERIKLTKSKNKKIRKLYKIQIGD